MVLRVAGHAIEWEPVLQVDGDEEHICPAGQLFRELFRWKDTPYESGQQAEGLGADCIGTLIPIVESLRGIASEDLPRLPPDSAMHDPESAREAMKVLLRRMEPHQKLEVPANGPMKVQPGDLFITGAPQGGPGHLAMVGPQCNTIWHATSGAGFHWTGWDFLTPQTVIAVYRLTDRHEWI